MDDIKPLVEWTNEKKNQIVSRPLKYCLLIFSFFFWIIGGLFAAIGGWMIAQDSVYEVFSGFAITPAAIFAGLGCLVFVISSFGVLGSYRENLFCLRVYKYSIISLLILIFAAGLVGFAFWPEIKKIIDNNIRIAIKNYRDDRGLRDMIDKVQRDMGCCGSLTIDDWDSNAYFICRKRGSYRSCGVPWSCCLPKHERNRQCGFKIRKNKHKRKGKPLSDDIYTIGCLDKLFEYLKDNMYLIGGVAVGSTLLLFIGIYMIHNFIKQIQKQIAIFNEANDVYQWTQNTVESPFPTT